MLASGERDAISFAEKKLWKQSLAASPKAVELLLEDQPQEAMEH